MPLAYDPEFAAALAVVAPLLPSGPKPAVGDALGRRARANHVFARMGSFFPAIPSIRRTDHTITAPDGVSITVAEFRKEGITSPTKAIYFIHAGGMILGSIDAFENSIAKHADNTGVPVFAVGYRLAPEHKHLVPVSDCFAGLEWLIAHATELGIDPAKIIVHGESAGGGLAAGACLMARDRNVSPPVAKLILNAPMLDDRSITPIADLEPFATWNSDDNITGWRALLGEAAGSSDPQAVSEYAAPARAKSLVGLPPTYIDCGQLDIFADEDTAFATRLMAARVPVEFHVYPGVPHGFKAYAPEASYAKSAQANLIRAITLV